MAKKSEKVELLRSIPLFSGCSDRELNAIARSLKEVNFPSGREICKEGETGVGLFVLLEGDTKVVVDGRTRRRMGPGAFFGEIALLDGGPRSASVIAESDVSMLALPFWAFRSTLKAYPSLAVKMLEEVCSRVRSMEKSISH